MQACAPVQAEKQQERRKAEGKQFSGTNYNLNKT